MFRKNNFHGTIQKGFALVIWAVVMTMLLSACGQASAPKIYRVGILSGLDFFTPAVDGFKTKMAELGYVEGENISYDVQATNVDFAAYQSISKKFVEDKVDLIFVFPTEASMEAKAAVQGTDVPVVFALAFTDVAGINLIDSIPVPGGNITGVRFPSAEAATKRLQILVELAPNAKRILVPYLKDYPNVPGQLDAIRPLAEESGIELIEFGAASPPELQAEMDRRAALDDIGLDAVLLLAEPLAGTPDFYGIIGKFSYEHHIPVGGTLISLGENYSSIFGVTPDAEVSGGQAAILADKIFRGATAGTIPVVTAENYFTINYKAAQELGVTVPDGLLKQADKIIR